MEAAAADGGVRLLAAAMSCEEVMRGIPRCNGIAEDPPAGRQRLVLQPPLSLLLPQHHTATQIEHPSLSGVKEALRGCHNPQWR